MSLSDREVLELAELCSAVVDGTLSEPARARLSAWLRGSDEARKYYVRAVSQSASLHQYASEMQLEAPARRVGLHLNWTSYWAWSLPLAAAAALLYFSLAPSRTDIAALSSSSKPEVYVAQLTGAKNSVWKTGTVQPSPGDHIRKGQRLELASGRAEITFDCGARVTLIAPASMDISSAWDSTLRQGTVLANVPPEAVGFRVSNSSVEVMDLGTEFTMIADASGAAEVLVLKGEVEAAPRKGDDQETILLKASEARRFAESGATTVPDSVEKFARFSERVSLEHFLPGISYIHWTFDESAGTTLSSEVVGSIFRGLDARLSISDSADPGSAHSVSSRGHALRFDGKLQASGRVPGISGSGPRTVAFWVKVPKEAVTDAWMVSWGTTLKKFNSRPVQISWNRRPGEGAFGALRTDFGGGYAIGAQDLRDGNWHHITVYIAPGEGEKSPVQVKQYIDGRLESSAITLTPGTARQASVAANAATDILWLGCRLTGKQPERFRGEIDELWVADRALEPDEIVSVMNENRLPPSGVASSL